MEETRPGPGAAAPSAPRHGTSLSDAPSKDAGWQGQTRMPLFFLPVFNPLGPGALAPDGAAGGHLPGDTSCPAWLLGAGLSGCLPVPPVLPASEGRSGRWGLQIREGFLPLLCAEERKEQLHNLRMPQGKVMSPRRVVPRWGLMLAEGWGLVPGDGEAELVAPGGWGQLAGGCRRPLKGSPRLSQAVTRASGRRRRGTWTPWASGCSPACWTRRGPAPRSCAGAAHRG